MEDGEYSRAVQMFRALDRLRRAWQNIELFGELNKSQFGTLMTLRHGGRPPHEKKRQELDEGMTVTRLASIMGQSLPALSKRVSVLEEMGYVERVPDLTDRRVTGVCLTQAGCQLLDAAHRQLTEELDAAMKALGEEQTEMLLQLMEELTQVLKQASQKQADEQEGTRQEC